MQRWTLLALEDLFVINRPHTHVEPQYLTRKIPWAQFYGGEVVEINGLPATVCGEEYPDGKFPVKFTGCGWHARVNPQHVQRVPRLA